MNMQVNLSKDELEKYVAMVIPYAKNEGEVNIDRIRDSMRSIFGTSKKNILYYGVIDYLKIDRTDTVLLVQGKEAKKIGAMYLTWRLEGKKHLIDLAPKWYWDISEEMDQFIPEQIKKELEGCKYYAKV